LPAMTTLERAPVSKANTSCRTQVPPRRLRQWQWTAPLWVSLCPPRCPQRRRFPQCSQRDPPTRAITRTPKEASPYRGVRTHAPTLIMRALTRPRLQLRLPPVLSRVTCPRGIACRLRRYYIPMQPPRLSQVRLPRNLHPLHLPVHLIKLFRRRLRRHGHDLTHGDNLGSHWPCQKPSV